MGSDVGQTREEVYSDHQAQTWSFGLETLIASESLTDDQQFSKPEISKHFACIEVPRSITAAIRCYTKFNADNYAKDSICAYID